MTVRFDETSDPLTVLLGPQAQQTCDLEAGETSVGVSEFDALVRITTRASDFVVRALARGVPVEGALPVQPAARVRRLARRHTQGQLQA